MTRTLEESLAAAYAVPCTICNAKVGEMCTSIINASKYRAPHARRLELARKGT